MLQVHVTASSTPKAGNWPQQVSRCKNVSVLPSKPPIRIEFPRFCRHREKQDPVSCIEKCEEFLAVCPFSDSEILATLILFLATLTLNFISALYYCKVRETPIETLSIFEDTRGSTKEGCYGPHSFPY